MVYNVRYKYLYDKTRYWNGWNRIGEGENYI